MRILTSLKWEIMDHDRDKDDVDNIKRNICSWGGEQYVSSEDIRCIATYIAGDNIKIKLENKIFHINHAGVAIHPGDRGDGDIC